MDLKEAWIYAALYCSVILSGYVHGRGGDSSSDEVSTVFEILSARPPQAINASFEDHFPVNVTVITYDDLGYYQPYYNQYPSYAASEQGPHWDILHGVCMNVQRGVNDTYLGAFSCPLPFEPAEFTACCGYRWAEFCCLPEHYLDDVDDMKSLGRAMFLTVAFMVFLLIPFAWLVYRDWETLNPTQDKPLLQVSSSWSERADMESGASESKYQVPPGSSSTASVATTGPSGKIYESIPSHSSNNKGYVSKGFPTALENDLIQKYMATMSTGSGRQGSDLMKLESVSSKQGSDQMQQECLSSHSYDRATPASGPIIAPVHGLSGGDDVADLRASQIIPAGHISRDCQEVLSPNVVDAITIPYRDSTATARDPFSDRRPENSVHTFNPEREDIIPNVSNVTVDNGNSDSLNDVQSYGNKSPKSLIGGNLEELQDTYDNLSVNTDLVDIYDKDPCLMSVLNEVAMQSLEGSESSDIVPGDATSFHNDVNNSPTVPTATKTTESKQPHFTVSGDHVTEFTNGIDFDSEITYFHNEDTAHKNSAGVVRPATSKALSGKVNNKPPPGSTSKQKTTRPATVPAGQAKGKPKRRTPGKQPQSKVIVVNPARKHSDAREDQSPRELTDIAKCSYKSSVLGPALNF